MQRLEKCTDCARHVRVSETTCPFCETALPSSYPPRARPSVAGRVGRFALFAASAAGVGVATGACGDGMTDALYGGPPEELPDAATGASTAGPRDAAAPADGSGAHDAATDVAVILPPYGLPPPPPPEDGGADGGDAGDADTD